MTARCVSSEQMFTFSFSPCCHYSMNHIRVLRDTSSLCEVMWWCKRAGIRAVQLRRAWGIRWDRRIEEEKHSWGSQRVIINKKMNSLWGGRRVRDRKNKEMEANCGSRRWKHTGPNNKQNRTNRRRTMCERETRMDSWYNCLNKRSRGKEWESSLFS